MACSKCNQNGIKVESENGALSKGVRKEKTIENYWPQGWNFPPLAPWVATVMTREEFVKYGLNSISSNGIVSESVWQDLWNWLFGSGGYQKPKCNEDCMYLPGPNGRVECLTETGIAGKWKVCGTYNGDPYCEDEGECDISDSDLPILKDPFDNEDDYGPVLV